MSEVVDKTGQRFGRLVVLNRLENRDGQVIWECQCDCGARKAVLSNNLRSGGTRSCGCLAREAARLGNARDRIGEIYGYSKVIRRGESRKRRAWWVLECVCGNEFELSSKALRPGRSLTCGCIRATRAIVPEVGQRACDMPSPKYPDGRTGTYAGYQAHVKVSEEPCAECDEARKNYNASRWRGLSDEERQAVRRKNAVAVQKYSENHPSRRRSTVTSRRDQRMPLIRDAKDRPCADCGVQYPYYVMQFDHVRGEKKFNLGGGWNNSIEAIQEEIAKCDVVCANCHAERTYQRMVS